MRKTSLGLLAASVVAAWSGGAVAAGYVNLPATGFAITGGTTAYTLCNTTGNFGSDDSIPPTPAANNTCAVFSNPGVTGFTRVASTVRNIVINNVHTNNTNRTVGTLTDEVWRQGTTTNYIFSMKVRLNNVDYKLNQAGSQYFEINDLARSGFTGRALSIAYFVNPPPAGADEVLYRAGRTFNSVPHPDCTTAPVPAICSNPGLNPPKDRPLTLPAAPANTPINNGGTANLGTGNWVMFTTDVNFNDPDGGSLRDSPYLYARTTCTTGFAARAGAIRLRQSGQEDQPQFEVQLTGYACSGTTNNE